jgi:CheY-like chemotaxis protein
MDVHAVRPVHFCLLNDAPHACVDRLASGLHGRRHRKGRDCAAVALHWPFAGSLASSSDGLANPSRAVEHGGSVVTSSSEGAITVLLADDHAIVRQGLRSVLDAYPDIEIVGEACNGEEAVSAVRHLRPSVVVMDINMPKMDGIAATRHITLQYPDIVVVGLSVNAGDDSTTAILTAGAVALIAKEAAVDQLYPTIQNALRAKRANI